MAFKSVWTAKDCMKNAIKNKQKHTLTHKKYCP